MKTKGNYCSGEDDLIFQENSAVPFVTQKGEACARQRVGPPNIGAAMDRKLRKIKRRKWVSGVCAGFAYYFGLPTWVVRMVWTASVAFVGFTGFLYILFWIFMPARQDLPTDYEERCE